jgi:hypothetical protein
MTEPDDVRRLISRADPARSLAPLRADKITRLTEDAMTTTDPRTTGAAPRSRRGLLIGGLAAAAAVAAIAIAAPFLTAPAAPPTVLALQPTDPMAMCAVITAEAIDDFAETAFRADVTDISEGTVTLRVTERFRGEVSDTVEIVQGTDTALDGGPIVFTDDAAYLISTADGEVLTCGLSDVASPELEALYAEAFAG